MADWFVIHFTPLRYVCVGIMQTTSVSLQRPLEHVGLSAVVSCSRRTIAAFRSPDSPRIRCMKQGIVGTEVELSKQAGECGRVNLSSGTRRDRKERPLETRRS